MRVLKEIVAACLIFVFCVLLNHNAYAREIINIDFDWKFIQKDVADAANPAFDDSSWRMLDLPHDWSIEGKYSQDIPGGERTGFLPIGMGWYRKELVAPEDWLNKKVVIQFDAVFMLSDTYINGKHLGQWPYGYTSFEYDLTPYLEAGKTNILAVKVDHSKGPAARWYCGSGIYGHVNLLVLPKTHIVPSGGVFVRTESAGPEKADLLIDTEVKNDGDTFSGTVIQVLKTKNGKTAAESKTPVTVAKGQVAVVEQKLDVRDPELWSPDNPYLYTLETVLKGSGDKVITPVGIRAIKYDGNGFWLNGVNMKMKGVCEHHDGGPIGSAFPDDLLEWRIRFLKKMGCNAIRTAHNPRTPEFYRICDRIGMLVLDEIFDGWEQKADNDYGGRFFKEHWKKDVEAWVRRDRNHPSVVMYSIGNETGYSDKFGITPYIKKFDATRPTTGGTISSGVDIVGLNGPGELPSAKRAHKRKHPGKPLVLTEAPHTLQTRGFYRVKNWWRDKKARIDSPAYGDEQIFFDGHLRDSSSYDNCAVRCTARDSWRQTLKYPFVVGEFRWTGFDYLGENTYSGGKWPSRAWNFGIIDLAGFPKDHYYFYQSIWTDTPMVHILPHWTHPHLKPGTVVPVVVYSNCEEVELFLNNKSLGKKKRTKLFDFIWKVPYQPGELQAIAYNAGEQKATAAHKTSGDPVRLKLLAHSSSLAADRRNTTMVDISTVDNQGAFVPWAHDKVKFKIDGPVKLLGFENGDIDDITRHRIPERKLFHGLARGFFQATDKGGPIEVTAAAILGDRLFQNTVQLALSAQSVMLRGKASPSDFEFRYTVDGSKPGRDSRLYRGPFKLDKACTINVLVLRNGKLYMNLQDKFQKGPEPRVIDPRFKAPSKRGRKKKGIPGK